MGRSSDTLLSLMWRMIKLILFCFKKKKKVNLPTFKVLHEFPEVENEQKSSETMAL